MRRSRSIDPLSVFALAICSASSLCIGGPAGGERVRATSMKVARRQPSDAVEPKNDDPGSSVGCAFYRLPPRALPSIAGLQPYARCLNARLFGRFQSDGLPAAGKTGDTRATAFAVGGFASARKYQTT